VDFLTNAYHTAIAYVERETDLSHEEAVRLFAAHKGDIFTAVAAHKEEKSAMSTMGLSDDLSYFKSVLPERWPVPAMEHCSDQYGTVGRDRFGYLFPPDAHGMLPGDVSLYDSLQRASSAVADLSKWTAPPKDDDDDDEKSRIATMMHYLYGVTTYSSPTKVFGTARRAKAEVSYNCMTSLWPKDVPYSSRSPNGLAAGTNSVVPIYSTAYALGFMSGTSPVKRYQSDDPWGMEPISSPRDYAYLPYVKTGTCTFELTTWDQVKGAAWAVRRPEFFIKFETKVVMYHSATALNRSLKSQRLKQKFKTLGVDVSGHLLALLLSSDAHYQLGIHAIMDNLYDGSYNRRVPYAFSDDNQELWHTPADYVAAACVALCFDLPSYVRRRAVQAIAAFTERRRM